jgi:hypothetical protein
MFHTKLSFTTTTEPMGIKMAMLNLSDYRNQILARVGEIGKLTPDTVKGRGVDALA